ncbi:MAG: S9 family peptidase [Muribaculaceae bacterium]|nr:S9 family peptidase [Muribaculaceae bacterium]
MVASASECNFVLQYPQARTVETVDDYFGLQVADPYRWLEDEKSAETKEWVKSQNKITDDYLSQIPFREDLRSRLTVLNNYTKKGMPWRGNDGRLYQSVNDGLKNQAVVMVTDNGVERVFLDPNTLSEDGTVALTGIFQSPDGKYTAYTISRSGSDWSEIYVMETSTGKLLDDHIEWAKFTDAQWHGDGFFYSAYPRPDGGRDFTASNEGHNIYYHKIGTSQSEDVVAFEDAAHPFHFHRAFVPEGTPYLFVISEGEGIGSALAVKNLNDGVLTVITDSQEYPMEIVGEADGKLYVLTSLGAPRNRLMRFSLSAPALECWEEVVPQSPDAVLTGVRMAGDRLVLNYEKDAISVVKVADMDGNIKNVVPLPGLGSVELSASKKHSDEVFLSFTSFTSPSSIYRYNPLSNEILMLYRPEVSGVDFDDYVTVQVFYTSKDGTRVPMFLTYKKGLKRDGRNPVYLYGYGGFNISLTPGYNPSRILWLENGGIYAQANLRGGAEYGEEWHQQGIKQNKLNVFNDFIAAAEYMIAEGWTTSELLTIEGGSNGGLLVGATVNLRPDLFKVAIPRVGVMDMMRYHLFTIGWNWASDYGTSGDSREMASYLLSYSPIHTIRNDGTPYPAILVTTADHDDRVVPAHSFKYAATLQAANTGSAPKLIRIDSKAGHGAGKPVSKVIDEYTDIYSFIFYNLGLTPR